MNVHSSNTVHNNLKSISSAEQYWEKQFSEEFTKSKIPYDYITRNSDASKEKAQIDLSLELCEKLLVLCNESDPRLHMLLTSIVVILINKYSGTKDVVIGIPIYRQRENKKFVNTTIPLRFKLTDDLTFKKLVLLLRTLIYEAVEYQDYQINSLANRLGILKESQDGALFDIAIMLENIHELEYVEELPLSLTFMFKRTGQTIKGFIRYDSHRYNESTIKSIILHINYLAGLLLKSVDTRIQDIDIILPEERKLLLNFNPLFTESNDKQTIHKQIEQRALEDPNRIALIAGDQKITYCELNQRAETVANQLVAWGVRLESVVGVMIERSVDMVISLFAVLKSGAAYLPINPDLPEERIAYMLENAQAKILITKTHILNSHSFVRLSGFENNDEIKIVKTEQRRSIAQLDDLPIPDRGLISLKNYKGKIGMASVANCISLLSTRGCPYHCLYCHKIWTKNHVSRSAENLFEELFYYAREGVRNFAIIDDCFNLDIKNGKRFFKKILQHKLDIQIFFPNGLRGDILTPDYIDLMVEAGTRGINLSLETASKRLQKLLKKNLNLGRFREVVEYIASRHPNVVLELATMHGFPTESEEEALQTLNFIKSIRWIHFPYIHILKIFPNTEMEAFALQNGVSKKQILASRNRAFHELPETLPFPKSFTKKYQADFMGDYFLDKKRLRKVLPIQLDVLEEQAIIEKYNAYLPTDIHSVGDVLKFAEIDDLQFTQKKPADLGSASNLFDRSNRIQDKPNAKKIVLLDLSQHFSSYKMLYNVAEQPLGLISLMTYLNDRFGDKIDGRIYKSGNDFDSFEDLRCLLSEFRPDFVGIRSLTFFREFFHETVSLLRQWGIKAPIVTGGPYASSDYDTILKDRHVDVVVLGEGEHTLGELIESMLTNGFVMPENHELRNIAGIVFREQGEVRTSNHPSCQILFMDQQVQESTLSQRFSGRVEVGRGEQLAYIMYTSGSTGLPKGVMVEHRQVNNCFQWMQSRFPITKDDVIVARTNLTFDPSVWEIFWPLQQGSTVNILTEEQSNDPEYLVDLMAGGQQTIMYCPSSLFTTMERSLRKRSKPLELTMPYLVIGAEPVSVDAVTSFYNNYSGEIVNTYGPTECTINNTFYTLERNSRRTFVPIGKPVSNNALYIVTDDLQLTPFGVSGELCISGKSVARGYINSPVINAACFVDNPFDSGKIYKTGDICRWHEDGVVEYIGRKDDQVKVRGYRIELGEIESVLSKHEMIEECAVVMRKKDLLVSNSQICRVCGISSHYPKIQINDDICNICDDFQRYKAFYDRYFQSLSDLKELINNANADQKPDYDCILMYAGGRAAGYALYHLVESGLKVLTLTYDHGYLGKRNLATIKRVTSDLSVENVVLRHPNSENILKVSAESAGTICKGCFYTSSALALQYALNRGIRVVVGATLSRGQIIDNKLSMFYSREFRDLEDFEGQINSFVERIPYLEKPIFEAIDIPQTWNSSKYDVKFIDYYRYCDVSNEEIIAYLNKKHSSWKTRKISNVYSTACPIKQFGDSLHLEMKGFHFYGSATHWEKRLGHLSTTNLFEDLRCQVTPEATSEFLKRIGYQEKAKVPKHNKHICAYWVSEQDIQIETLREYLKRYLPTYMMPTYFSRLPVLPRTPEGKVDRQSLPAINFSGNIDCSAPDNEIEKKLTAIWSELLDIDAGSFGVDDNFFDIGGDSLMVTQLRMIILEKFIRSQQCFESIEEDAFYELIDLGLIMRKPTIREFAKHLKYLIDKTTRLSCQ